MATPPNSNPQIQFAQTIPPALDAGDYTLTITQSVTFTGQNPPPSPSNYVTSVAFSVAGPAFSIDPSVVYSQFPPPGGRGLYNNYLPQVILSNASLPWTRTLEDSNPSGAVPPFMGILVISANDMTPDASSAWSSSTTYSTGDLVSYNGVSYIALQLQLNQGPNLGQKPDTSSTYWAPAAPVPFTGTVADLLNPTAQGNESSTSTFTGPSGAYLPNVEPTTDRVTLLDMPGSLFNSIAPSASDLQYLAHVRWTDQSAKAQQNPTGWYAAIVANRFVPAGVTSSAYLVSFEGLTDFLPGGSTGPVATDYVRLAVLASWSFTDLSNIDGLAGSFGADLQDLVSPAPPVLQLPLAPPPSGADPTAVATAQAITDAGYVALNHLRRDGEPIASFYRGPLAPVQVPEQSATYITPDPDDPNQTLPQNNPSWPTSDSALRFDPTLGMLDVSYAAAWEIGKLMALRDPQYGAALRSFRQQSEQNAMTLLQQGKVNQNLPALRVPQTFAALTAHGHFQRSVMSLIAKKVAPLLLGDAHRKPAFGRTEKFSRGHKRQHPNGAEGAQEPNPPTGTSGQTPRERGTAHASNRFEMLVTGVQTSTIVTRMQQFADNPSNFAALWGTPPNTTVPPVVVSFIQQLALLENVPFNYLVPDARMLPTESLRFFYIDPNWIRALLDGALSVGRATSLDQAHDSGLLLYLLDLLSDPPLSQPLYLSGILLRSQLVADMPGLEVRGCSDTAGTIPLPTLSAELLGNNVMMFIFAGVVQNVMVSEPPEGIQFGGNPNGDTDYTIDLRGLGATGGTALGAPIQGNNNSLSIATNPSGNAWRNQSLFVINAATLAAAIQTALSQFTPNEWPASPPTITSTEFAIEMVEAPESGVFQISPPTNAIDSSQWTSSGKNGDALRVTQAAALPGSGRAAARVAAARARVDKLLKEI